ALGVQIGGDGTERFLRALFLSSSPPPSPLDRPLLAGDPLAGEPRFVGYRPDEALVAALRDGRIDAFLGHATAAAPATLLGGSEIVANFSLGETAAPVAAAHGIVLVTRRDRVTGRPADPAGGFLAALVRGAGR